MILHTAINVGYLPRPNTVEVVISDQECDPAFTATAFVIPVFDDGTILLANNTRRGPEIPGGHVDLGETLIEAAIRECMEEAGCVVEGITPVGYLRMISKGVAPEGYAYPFPNSFQQFYVARVKEVLPYVANDECFAPMRVSLDDLVDHERASVAIFAREAVRKLGK